MNVARILADSAKYFPQRTVVIDQGVETTYAQLDEESGRVAQALVDMGMKPGDLAAICMPNSRQWLAVYFGIIKAGCAAATLSAALPRGELLPLLVDGKPKLLFTTQDKLDMLKDGPEALPCPVVAPGGEYTYEGLLAGATTPMALIERDRDDVAAVLYTGGTTGLAKGVMLSHTNLLSSAHTASRYERSSENDRALCFLPLNHVFGQVHISLSTILTAGSLVLLPAFDPEQVLHALSNLGVTKFYAVPTIYVRLLSVPDLKAKLGTVRYTFSAAASMALELVREWKQTTGLDIYECYGMTETTAITTYNHFYRHKVGSVGTQAGIIEVAIMDGTGKPVPNGKEGEICIAGPNIMKGYMNRPQETKEAFWGKWLRSGDIGYLDDEGYLFIVDRLKDMIITGGENVYPREVEELLFQRPEIEECAVVGLPDREYGERVTAFVVLKPGAVLDPQEIRAFLKSNMSAYKVPKQVIAVTELPKSATGKILKRNLRQSQAAS